MKVCLGVQELTVDNAALQSQSSESQFSYSEPWKICRKADLQFKINLLNYPEKNRSAVPLKMKQ